MRECSTLSVTQCEDWQCTLGVIQVEDCETHSCASLAMHIWGHQLETVVLYSLVASLDPFLVATMWRRPHAFCVSIISSLMRSSLMFCFLCCCLCCNQDSRGLFCPLLSTRSGDHCEFRQNPSNDAGFAMEFSM